MRILVGTNKGLPHCLGGMFMTLRACPVNATNIQLGVSESVSRRRDVRVI
jgi:hypothetical protein